MSEATRFDIFNRIPLIEGGQGMQPHPNLTSAFTLVITPLTGYCQLLLAVLMRLYGHNSVIREIADIQELNWPIVHAHLHNLVGGWHKSV